VVVSWPSLRLCKKRAICPLSVAVSKSSPIAPDGMRYRYYVFHVLLQRRHRTRQDNENRRTGRSRRRVVVVAQRAIESPSRARSS
jgi:hypothetical protein